MSIANVKMCANYYISDFKTINCNSNVIWVYNECEERMKLFFSFVASICYAIKCVQYTHVIRGTRTKKHCNLQYR